MKGLGLTQNEKQRAYRRLRYGARTAEPIIGHIMLHLNNTIQQMEEYPECADAAHKYRLMHRLVSRGVITTYNQYNRVAKRLLEQ